MSFDKRLCIKKGLFDAPSTIHIITPELVQNLRSNDEAMPAKPKVRLCQANILGNQVRAHFSMEEDVCQHLVSKPLLIDSLELFQRVVVLQQPNRWFFTAYRDKLILVRFNTGNMRIPRWIRLCGADQVFIGAVRLPLLFKQPFTLLICSISSRGFRLLDALHMLGGIGIRLGIFRKHGFLILSCPLQGILLLLSLQGLLLSLRLLFFLSLQGLLLSLLLLFFFSVGFICIELLYKFNLTAALTL